MKKLGVFLILVVFFFATPSFTCAEIKGSKPVPFTIMNSQHKATIVNDQCNSDDAEQDVYMDKDENGVQVIKWTWNDKGSSWCGWQIQELPITNLKDYETYGYQLEIVLKGSWSKKAPQIKFIDVDDKPSKLIGIKEKYINGNPLDSCVVRVPLDKFELSKRIDIENIKFLQFDAAFDSITGSIRLYSIKIIPKQ